MIKQTLNQYYKHAYCMGITDKERGYEMDSCPYKNCVAKKYWIAGYNGIKITNFTNWHKKQNNG